MTCSREVNSAFVRILFECVSVLAFLACPFAGPRSALREVCLEVSGTGIGKQEGGRGGEPVAELLHDPVHAASALLLSYDPVAHASACQPLFHLSRAVRKSTGLGRFCSLSTVGVSV